MIGPLRRRHRVIFAVLAVVLPLLLYAALRARRIPPVMDSLPGAVAPVGEGR